MRAWWVGLALGIGLLAVGLFGWTGDPPPEIGASPPVSSVGTPATPAKARAEAAPPREIDPELTRSASSVGRPTRVDRSAADPDLLTRYAHGEHYGKVERVDPPVRPDGGASLWQATRLDADAAWRDRARDAVADVTSDLDPEVRDDVSAAIDAYVDTVTEARSEVVAGALSRKAFRALLADAASDTQRDLEQILGDAQAAGRVFDAVADASNPVR
ncbi:MAG: hypothetical protein AAF602_13655 [Myxococcota bacterium]